MRCSNAQKIQPNGRCTNRKILICARILSVPPSFSFGGFRFIAHPSIDPELAELFQNVRPPIAAASSNFEMANAPTSLPIVNRSRGHSQTFCEFALLEQTVARAVNRLLAFYFLIHAQILCASAQAVVTAKSRFLSQFAIAFA